MSHVQFDFRSNYLFKSTQVHIILPDVPWGGDPKEFYESGKKYPVLWLLHGGTDDSSDWSRLTRIELYARENNLIVVMPDAMNSFYANWPNAFMGFDMYDFFFKELMPMVYNWFPASDKPEDNFIAGQSMGGLGTAKFVANHPELFGGAAIFSVGAVDLNREDPMPRAKKIIRQYELANGSLENAVNSPDNYWQILKDRKDELPPVYCSCGTADDHYEDVYLPFKRYALENEIPITFREIEGYAHEWRLWDLEIQYVLKMWGIMK